MGVPEHDQAFGPQATDSVRWLLVPGRLARGKKARVAVVTADRNTRKRLGRVAAAQQRLNDALGRLARLN